MIFLNCVCGEIGTIESTPTCVTYDSTKLNNTNEGLNYIEIKNALFDNLYLSTDPHCGEENAEGIPFVWGYDTVLYATFDGNTLAGNIDLSLESISHLIIKRRVVGEFTWKTIYVKEIKTIEDFDLSGIDYTARSGVEYEYAAVPVFHGYEGNYSTATSCTTLDRIFIVGADRVVSTEITDGYCDTVRNVPSSTNVLLNSKYPIYIRNTIANYDSGSLSANYIDRDDYCLLIDTDDIDRVTYQKSVMDFLCDGKPKLLKHFDGRMWLIMVTGNPTDTADGYYKIRKINFDWEEIGDCESEEDLYYANLTNITSEWWTN